MRYLLLIALFLVGCGTSDTTFNPAVSQTATSTNTNTNTIKLGAIISQDPLGDPDTQAALRLAEQDVNAYLQKAGSDRRISLQVEGTGYDPAKAVSALQRLQAAGINTIVGPETSAELKALQGTPNAVLISHGATASALALPGDNIFQLIPTDVSQGRVIAGQLAAAGARQVVIVYRDDAFGQGLRDSVSAACSARGITVKARIPLTEEYGKIAAQLAQEVTGPDVAVQLSAFGEEASRLFEANPPLARWVGSDGTAKSREILESPTASQFAVRTGFVNPLFALPTNRKTARLVQRISAAAGTDAQALSVAAYDGVWLAALASLQGPLVGPAFLTTADNFFGGTGWTELNEAGDRADGDYDLWQIVDGAWKATGRINAM